MYTLLKLGNLIFFFFREIPQCEGVLGNDPDHFIRREKNTKHGQKRNDCKKRKRRGLQYKQNEKPFQNTLSRLVRRSLGPDLNIGEDQFINLDKIHSFEKLCD